MLSQFLSILSILHLVSFSFPCFARSPDDDERHAISTNEQYISDVTNKSKIEPKVQSVFSHVFSQLKDEVNVYPTENYYYFKYFDGGHEIWGNLRFDFEKSPKGLLSFAFFSHIDAPNVIEDLDYLTGSGFLGPNEGVFLKKIRALSYEVVYNNKRVVFNLNDLPQNLPKDMKLLTSEEFLYRTFDESGFQFILIYNKDAKQFNFVLDPSAILPDTLQPLCEGVVVGRRTGFIFYKNSALSRNTLIGVNAYNIRRNNYYDGPFDQLADNFIKGDNLQKYMEEAYPYVRGRIDQHGVFLNFSGPEKKSNSRLALTPYIQYYSQGEVLSNVKRCESKAKKKRPEGTVICLTRDYKQNIPGSTSEVKPPLGEADE